MTWGAVQGAVLTLAVVVALMNFSSLVKTANYAIATLDMKQGVIVLILSALSAPLENTLLVE